MNRNLVMGGMMISIITAVIFIGYSPVKSIGLLVLVLGALYSSMRRQPQRGQKKFLDLSMFEEREERKASLYSNYSQHDRQTQQFQSQRISDRFPSDSLPQNRDINHSPIREQDFQSYVQNPVESRIISDTPVAPKKKKNFSALYENHKESNKLLTFEESMIGDPMSGKVLDTDIYKRSEPPKSKSKQQQDQFEKTKVLLQKRLPYLDDYARGVKDMTLRLIKFYMTHFKTSMTALNTFMKNHFNRQIYEMEYFNQTKYFQLDIISLENVIELESLMETQLIIKPLDFQRFEKEKVYFKEIVQSVKLCMSICQNDLGKVQRIIEMENEPFDAIFVLDLFVQIIKQSVKLDKSVEIIAVDALKDVHFDWDKEFTEYSTRNVFLMGQQVNYYSDQLLMLLKVGENTLPKVNRDFILYTPQNDMMIYYAIAYYIFHLQLLPKASLLALSKSTNVLVQQINEMRQHLSYQCRL